MSRFGIIPGHRDSISPYRSQLAGVSAQGGIMRAAVLDGITSHITIDGLAADAYSQTKVATGYVMLVKAPTDTDFHFWATLATANDTSEYSGVVNQTGGAGVEGRLRSIIGHLGATLSNVAGTAATEHVDGAWHLLHCADHYNAPNGDLYAQVDGATREVLDSYLRYATPSPDFTLFTLGARRYKSGPTVDVLNDCTIGYLARYDDEVLDQAAWTAIYDAWNSGGGRVDTRRISEAIAGELSTGTCKWAGNLDESVPHINTDSVAAPIYVDCTFEPAGY